MNRIIVSINLQRSSHFRVDLCHSCHEFLEVNASVSVLVSVFDDLVHFGT